MTRYDEQLGDDQQLIAYDSVNKVLYIPVVEKGGVVTKKNLVYVLKADCLEFAGIEDGRRVADTATVR